MKKLLGNIKRGLIGILESQTESAALLPADLKANVLTHSIQGQKITYYQIGKGERPVLFVGGTHGNEVGAVALVTHLAAYL